MRRRLQAFGIRGDKLLERTMPLWSSERASSNLPFFPLFAGNASKFVEKREDLKWLIKLAMLTLVSGGKAQSFESRDK